MLQAYAWYQDSIVFLFKQKTAYEMRISDWSSDVCSSDLEWMISVAELHGDTAVHIPLGAHQRRVEEELDPACPVDVDEFRRQQIGRASCRERVCQYV